MTDEQGFGCHTNTSATKNKIVLLSRHVKIFHNGLQQCFSGFALNRSSTWVTVTKVSLPLFS